MSHALHSCTGGRPAGGCEVDKQLVCACRYLTVAKNKRLRVFTVPREHVDEVGGHGWLESEDSFVARLHFGLP